MSEITLIQQMSAADQRFDRYNTLFLGELPYEPLPDDAKVGISGLCRITKRSGSRTTELYDHLDNLPGIIEDILLEHDLAAMSDDEAVFAFVDDETREKVSSTVSDIFIQWEIAHSRQGLETLLPSKNSQAKWLVVETAAAVMQVVGEVDNLNVQSKRDRQDVSRIICNWGPNFARQWFDGTIIKQWMDSNSIAETEQAEWLKTFTPGIRKRLAVSNISDPLKALSQVQNNLETYLSDQAIAEHLGWTEIEVQAVFAPGMRKRLAVHNISDPLKGCRDWVGGKISLSINKDNVKDNKLARLGIITKLNLED